MAIPRVLRFDAEGRPLEFSALLLRARRLLESQVQAHETLWAHTFGDLPEPADPAPLADDPTPADSDRYARERADVTAWKSRDAAASIALSSLLPESEETHFTQVRTASEFLIAIKAHYVTPTTVSLGRLFLPFLFPDLALFECTANLITHLRSLDSSYHATCADARLHCTLPPWRLLSISSPLASLTALPRFDVESNLRSVASASDVVPPPLFHVCTVPQLPTFTASLATAATDVTAAAVTTSSRSQGRSGRRGGQGAGGGGGGGGGDVASGGGGSAGAGGAPRAPAGDSPAAAGGGDARVRQPPTGLPAAGGGAAAWYLTRQQQQQHQPLPSQQPQQQQRQQQVSGQGPGQRQLQRGVTYGPALWGMSASQLVDLFGTPDTMYAVVDSSASDSVYSSVVSLGASLAEVLVASVGTCVDTSLGAAPKDASLSYTLDSGASHCFFHDRMTLTPLPTPVFVALADPTSGPVTARYTTTLPCPAVPSGPLTVFHVPSFSRNLVGVRPLVSQHVGVWIEPSAGLWSLHTSHWPPRAAAAEVVAAAAAVAAATPAAAAAAPAAAAAVVAAAAAAATAATAPDPCHCPPSHSRISPGCRVSRGSCVWSGSCVWYSCCVVLLPDACPPHCFVAPPDGAPVHFSPARYVYPCVEGQLRATPHSSSLCPATEPFETLHLDVWGPALRPGLERESFFLVVVDDYSRYTTVFPLAKKSDVTSTLIRWLLTTAATLGRRVSCLHSDRRGEFRSSIFAGFCRERRICQSWTLLESPQQNGVAERRICLVMEIARTFMTHAHAPHFLWPYAVRYAAHQLNLWPRVSRTEVSLTSLWTGSPGAASRFRVWGCLALVRNTSVDKISPCTVSCMFLGFPENSSDYTFYHPPLHQFFESRDVRFNESVPYYPPPPGPAPSGVAPQLQPPSPQSSSQPTADPAGACFRGEDPGGASSRGVGVGAESVPVRGPGYGGAGVRAEPVTAGDSSLRGAGVSGAVLGGATTWGAPSAGPGEPGTDPVTSGGAGSGGGGTAAAVGSRGERVGAAAAGAIVAGGAAAAAAATAGAGAAAGAAAAAAAAVVAAAATSSSSVFPPPLTPWSPPLSHTWPSRRSPRARPSSRVPFTDLRTAPFRSSPPRFSPSVLPSPPESALTASLSTLVRDYYGTYHLVLSRILASLVTDPRASLSSVSALTAAITEFASTRCLDYATSLVVAPPTSPLDVGGSLPLAMMP
ncbi:unnamed protein product [Closterium sp. NIES-54]